MLDLDLGGKGSRKKMDLYITLAPFFEDSIFEFGCCIAKKSIKAKNNSLTSMQLFGSWCTIVFTVNSVILSC